MTVFAASLSYAQGPLTNESICKLVNSHVGDDVILRIIAFEPGSFDVTVDGILALKHAGVSDQVIAVLLDKERTASTSAGSFVDRHAPLLPTNTHAGATDNVTRQSTEGSKINPRLLQTEPLHSLTIEDGTTVKLRTLKNLSSENTSVGDEIHLQVVEDIIVAGRTLVPRGAFALGTVEDIRQSGLVGRGGKLAFKIEYLLAPGNLRIPLRMSPDGGQPYSAITDDILISAPLQWTTAAFLFKRGKQAIMPRGTILTACVDGDFSFDARVPR